jgi:hypothetical protein
VVLDSPGSFESELAALKGLEILRDLKKANEVTFSLAFVTTQEQVNALAPAIARKAEGDAILWFAYPKGTSKKYKSQIARHHGWNAHGQQDFEPVRMVAIDALPPHVRRRLHRTEDNHLLSMQHLPTKPNRNR